MSQLGQNLPVPFSTVNRRTVRRTGGVVDVTGSSQSPAVHVSGVGVGLALVGGAVGVAVGAMTAGGVDCGLDCGVGVASGRTGATALPPQAAAKSAAPTRAVLNRTVMSTSFPNAPPVTNAAKN